MEHLQTIQLGLYNPVSVNGSTMACTVCCVTRAFLNGQVYEGFAFCSFLINTSCNTILSIYLT